MDHITDAAAAAAAVKLAWCERRIGPCCVRKCKTGAHILWEAVKLFRKHSCSPKSTNTATPQTCLHLPAVHCSHRQERTEAHSISVVHRATHLVACEHANKVWEGQHEVVVDSPAEATASISSQQGRQEFCKGPGACLLIGHTELVQGLHQRCHHLNTHCIAVVAQQVQKRPAEQKKACERGRAHMAADHGSSMLSQCP